MRRLRKEIGMKEEIEAFTKSVKLMNLYAIHSFSEIIADAISLASELGITAYDGAFLALASKTDTRLLTLDIKLASKIKGTKYHALIDAPSN